MQSERLHTQQEDSLSSPAYRIRLQDQLTRGDLEEVRKELDEISNVLTWQINDEMFDLHGWLGITRQVAKTRHPWNALTADAIDASDQKLKANNKTRRQLVIGITGEYIKALRKYPPEHEAYLRAAYFAAVTMAHEIAHAVWHQDFRSTDYKASGSEPFVGNDAEDELGFSFISWIFSDHIQEMCDMGPGFRFLDFETPLCWKPMSRVGQKDRYKTHYSISVDYMQESFTEAFWSRLPDRSADDFSSKARGTLKPRTGKQEPTTATANIPQFDLDDDGNPRLFRTGTKSGAAFKKNELTSAEITWLVSKKRAGNPLIRYGDDGKRIGGGVKGNLRSGIRTSLLSRDEDDDEDDLFFGYDVRDLDPDDGYLDEDLGTASNAPIPEGTDKIRVRYKPVQRRASTPKRRRDSNDDEEEDVRPTQRRKLDVSGKSLGKADLQYRFGNEDYDCTDVNELLRNKSTGSIAHLTHVEARDYCQLHGIEFRLKFISSEQWQRAKLNIMDRGDAALIQRIKQFSLEKAEELFKNDLAACIMIKEARTVGISRWDDEDLKDFLKKRGVSLASSNNMDGNRDLHISRVRERIAYDIGGLKEKYQEQQVNAQRPVTTPVGPKLPQSTSGKAPEQHTATTTAEDDTTAVENWSDEDFKSFFRTNKLPDWGDREVRLRRVERFQEEKSTGKPVSRRDINFDDTGNTYLRLDDQGEELYVFLGDTEKSSVASLKKALFLKAILPSDSIPDIYPDKNSLGQPPMEDHRPLSYYGHGRRGLKDFWLVVRYEEGQAPSGSGGSRLDSAEPFIYHLKGAVPITGLSGTGSQANPYSLSEEVSKVLQTSSGNGKVVPKAEPYSLSEELQFNVRKGTDVLQASERKDPLALLFLCSFVLQPIRFKCCSPYISS